MPIWCWQKRVLITWVLTRWSTSPLFSHCSSWIETFHRNGLTEAVLSLVHLIPLTMRDFIFLLKYIKDTVYIPPLLSTLPERAGKIKAAIVADLLLCLQTCELKLNTGVTFAGLLMVFSLSIEYCHKNLSRYKGKGHPITCSGSTEWMQRYSCNPFVTLCTRRGRVIITAPATLSPDKTTSTDCTGGWVGPDSPAPLHLMFNPKLFTPWRVTIPTDILILMLSLKTENANLTGKNEHNALWHWKNNYSGKFCVVFKQPHRVVACEDMPWCAVSCCGSFKQPQFVVACEDMPWCAISCCGCF